MDGDSNKVEGQEKGTKEWREEEMKGEGGKKKGEKEERKEGGMKTIFQSQSSESQMECECVNWHRRDTRHIHNAVKEDYQIKVIE